MRARHKDNVRAGRSNRGELPFRELYQSRFGFVRVKQVSGDDHEVDTVVRVARELHRSFERPLKILRPFASSVLKKGALRTQMKIGQMKKSQGV